MRTPTAFSMLAFASMLLFTAGCQQTSATGPRANPPITAAEKTANPGNASNGDDYPDGRAVATAGVVQSTNNPGDASDGNSSSAATPRSLVKAQRTTNNPGDSSNGNAFH